MVSPSEAGAGTCSAVLCVARGLLVACHLADGVTLAMDERATPGYTWRHAFRGSLVGVCMLGMEQVGLSSPIAAAPVEHRVHYRDAGCELWLYPDAAWIKFRQPQRVVSFAPYRPGLCDAGSVAILQVKNADLPLGRDPLELLGARMAKLDAAGVGMLTSRRVTSVEWARCAHAGSSARAFVTAGMSNAVRIADTPGPLVGLGTINIVAQLDVPLADGALIEALSLVAEARTLAVLESAEPSRRGSGRATGTGTDCISVCCPRADVGATYAGKHTAVGHVLGAAVLSATRAALAAWRAERR